MYVLISFHVPEILDICIIFSAICDGRYTRSNTSCRKRCLNYETRVRVSKSALKCQNDLNKLNESKDGLGNIICPMVKDEEKS